MILVTGHPVRIHTKGNQNRFLNEYGNLQSSVTQIPIMCEKVNSLSRGFFLVQNFGQLPWKRHLSTVREMFKSCLLETASSQAGTSLVCYSLALIVLSHGVRAGGTHG